MFKLTLSPSTKANDRYEVYRNTGFFLCPSNSVTSVAFGTADADAGPGNQLGYATAEGFLQTTGSPTPGYTSTTRVSTGAGWWTLPGGYTPKITKVGKPQEKAYMADAGKFYN